MKQINKFGIWAWSVVALLIGIFAVLPVSRIIDPVSTVLLASDGSLLGAKTAVDQQWRFPSSDSIPIKFEKAILIYEDRRFFHHHGIDIIRVVKSLLDNLKNEGIKSGGSTINMQLARIYLRNPNRNVVNKVYEMLIALKTDLLLGKRDVLNQYISNAPFGGNVVGLEAASWRYYFKTAEDLSWAECATLAVLPNNPSMIHPNKNRIFLKEKRDRLLKKLLKFKVIDREMYDLSLLEDLPDKVYSLPMEAPHLLERFRTKYHGNNLIQSTIHPKLQSQINDIVKNHQAHIEMNGIHNMAVVVIDNKKNEVISYVGNSTKSGKVNHEHFVDMIDAGRSSGSILKPFLYLAAINEGIISPGQLLPDVPGRISGYRPRNFNRSYDGAIHADKALAKSLNIPFVYLLQTYSIDKFLRILRSMGFTSFEKNADHFGLPLVLGGGDVKLWDLMHAYSGLAKTLNSYSENQNYNSGDWLRPVLTQNSKKENIIEQENAIHFNAGSIYLCFNAMTQLERPGEMGEWERFRSSRKIAWKTGTSFKFKDAWSLGITPEYTVGIWVGNATGEGRPGLVGVKAAAPLLFDVFSILGPTTWFEEPADDLKDIIICRDSGYPASSSCDKIDTVPIPYYANVKKLCPYHKVVLVDHEENWRFRVECSFSTDVEVKKYFVLPPLEEHYYSLNHPEYKLMPRVHPDCLEDTREEANMALIYPRDLTKIHIPVDYDGEKGRVVFRLTHKIPSSTVYWYIDDELIKSTEQFHEVEIVRPPGRYSLYILDEKRGRIASVFSSTGLNNI